MVTTNKTQCTKCCSNLTLKCFVDAFVNVDAQIATNFDSVLLTIHFSAVMKTPVLGNLYKLFRFAHHIFTGSLPLGVKNEENMTIVLFFSLSAMENCS